MEATACANALLLEEHYSEAIALYQTSQTAEAAANLILAHIRANLPALEVARQVKASYPQDFLVSYRFGQALFQAEHFTEALEAFKAASNQPLVASYVTKCERELKRSAQRSAQYSWFQTDLQVILELPVKVAGPERMRIEADEYRIEVSAVSTSNQEYHLIVNLLQPIDPGATSTRVTPSHVEVTLRKKSAVNWVAVEAAALTQPLKYPSSKKKDWSHLDQDLERELKQEKPQGDEALMSLFRQIYENADENARRAMNKSYQTSSGTALSTNWEEEAQKDYGNKDRLPAPPGQEWAPKDS
jgi:suppressor of G2 allele of SKP1